MPNIGFFPPKYDQANVNIGNLIANPTRIERRLNIINQDRYIVDYVFNQTSANGGGVIFDRVKQDLYLDRDAQAIDDGAEFPKLTGEDVESDIAMVKRYGGEVDLTFAAVRRNDTSAYQRKVNQLANTVLRKANRVAVAALERDEDIPEYVIGTDWTSASGDPLGDLATAQSMIDDSEMGYQSDTVLINPQDALTLRKRKDIRDALPRESVELNPVLSRDLAGLLELNFIKSPFVPKGEAWLVSSGTLGTFADEEGGLKADTYDEKNRHVHVLQAWRTFVPVVTDPFAAVRLKGLSA